MLNLNYYFVDVGDNYCEIAPRSCVLSLRDAILEKDKNSLIVMREFIVNTFKKKSFVSPMEEFKMVFVNKQGKLDVETEVQNDEDRSLVDALVHSGKYDIYLMTPGQTLSVKCTVYPNHIEYRSIRYDYLRSPEKKVKKRGN